MRKKPEALSFEEKLDIVERISKDTTRGWYPTVAQMREHGVEEDLEKFSYLILFFASNPFNLPDDKEYKETVSYCTSLSRKIA